MARKDPPQWYVKFRNRLVLKLNGLRLDPVFCAVFFLLAAGSLYRGIRFQNANMYYSAVICAFAGVMVLRRIRRIKKREQSEKNNITEEKTND